MATFVLIHGAWHGNWCWELVRPILQKHGHKVIALDLPGMGNDTTVPTEISLESWAYFVSEHIRQQDEQVILVGHSLGGLVISQAAEYAYDKIQGLIYVSGFLIPSGKTLSDILQEHAELLEVSLELTLSEDESTSRLSTRDVRNVFYNTTPENLVDRAIENVGITPMLLYHSSVALTDMHFGQTPKSYIECLRDRAIPIALQRTMVSKVPAMSVSTLNSDHSPFYSAPEQLALELIKLTRLMSLIGKIK